MKKILLAALATLSLSACTLPAMSLIGPAAPAPLAATTIDDKALRTAWQSFDIALDAIDLLIDRKVIVPGSPKAIALADLIDKVTAALSAAEHAAAAGSTTSYATALTEARSALTDMRAVLRS